MRHQRITTYGRMSTALALLSDRRLGELLAATPGRPTYTSVVARLTVADTPVFVKQVPLSALEQEPDNMRSTANLFGLPTYYQYGAGSAGFGVWRELAAHVLTTDLVLTGACESFPLMYHWRILPGSVPTPEVALPAERAGSVAWWAGSAAVGDRLAAIADASARVVLFLEHIPWTVHEWLDTGVDPAAACALLEPALHTEVPRMNAGGLLHFDTHFGNLLTDGERLYFADLGLATSPRFDLSASEAAFVAAHAGYDAARARAALVNALVFRAVGAADRDAVIRQYADGGTAGDLPAAVAAVVRRHAPAVVEFNDFWARLRGESRLTRWGAS